MKKILLIDLLILVITLTFSISGYAKKTTTPSQQLDQIVAIINDDVVTKTELNHALTGIKMQMSQQNAPMPQEDALEKKVLDQLINKKLQLQIAKQAGINIPDSEIDATVERIAQQNNMTTQEMYQRLNQDGITTADYRSEIHDQMAVQKLQQQEVVSHITIRPEEVNAFMRSKSWQKNVAKEYKLDDILIPFSDTPSPEEIATAKKHAEEILAKLKQGQNFATLAQTESGDNSHALEGGDLGWRKLPEIPSAFADKVVSMHAKEINGPIQTPNGFHIIRLADVRAAASDQAAPDRKQIEDFLMQRKFEEAMQNWVSKLRSQAFIVTNPTQ